MRLYDYILEHMEAILAEWENFARRIQPSDANLDVKELRDHAEQMLRTIAEDMQHSQTEKQSTEKSKGDQADPSRSTPAQSHADERLESGFSLSLLVAEYRALRASVLRLWSHEATDREQVALEDVTRFNEAIDQALTESIGRYAEAVRVQQDVFVGTLGHDLRTPLQSLSVGTEVLMHSPDSDRKLVELGAKMNRSVKRMTAMIDNLLDFTQSRIGSGIDIDAKEVDLATVAEQMVEEIQSYNPDRVITNSSSGNSIGEYDAGRIARIYQNLIGNALQHGAKDKPVRVETVGESDQVTIKVHNQGTSIPKPDQEKIFDLLFRHSSSQTGSDANLGLGLYIVKEIASAHGGSIGLTSSDEYGTEFTVRLPKHR